ncbi:hypothetical protein ACK1O1_01090 [Stenotrophomonas maltophilia]|uniref:hypothetical protein n=1 Tax=Stenotrophomonas TaxID=40323 RepID=UPI00201CD446|nr:MULTISPECIES: hypothetical protein [Stenotrophomonas]MBN5023952.1 hypothetical protein [Stenotrophomonas maltophilia]MDH1272831.1 hypothetical protein [Stenotrophomonas sp. GD03937]MDH1484534.1 hypothetical protein [Stenotrophomonas sp. GD03712]UQY94328.1 hypothetical protein LZ605_14415 [Stenotrophomonas maltophilia]WON68977.1 hypothetical protein RWT08_01065 [Stenotrophomonas maltophilia]
MSKSHQRDISEVLKLLDAQISRQGTHVSAHERNLKLDLVGFLNSTGGKSSLERALKLTKKVPPAR